MCDRAGCKNRIRSCGDVQGDTLPCFEQAEAPAPPQGSPSKSSELLAGSCPECGSADTEWSCGQQTNSCVADGRLRMGEVITIFTLGCNSCSETIRIIDGDEVARIMNQYR